MRIRLIIPLTIASWLATTSTAAGQHVPEVADHDVRSAATAALDWFMTRPNPLGPRERTLVISDLTTRYTSALDDAGSYRLEAASRRDLRLRGAALERIAARAGVPIRTCDDLSNDLSLCEIPQPWVWLIIHNPGIRGNRAVILLELLEHEDRGEDNPVMGAEIWEVFLSRDKGVWKVDRAAITAVS